MLTGEDYIDQEETPGPDELCDLSRQGCLPDTGHYSQAATGLCTEGIELDADEMAIYAEELLRELTLNGPGSEDFTLADL